ncbi:MAG: hypothetical protein DRQ40_04705 [Gammaproteobacteria bacterium]|nr:MAG: hypothetical protein DRQ40_04705 [Gammaproteobacteria bacterium]
MGWGYCGQDSVGRDIGYCIEASCDHPGCKYIINRGLGCICGTMHGEDEYSCEKYFCGEHKASLFLEDLVTETVDSEKVQVLILKDLKCYYHMYEEGTTCISCYERNEKYIREEISSLKEKYERIEG